ncbi:MAG: phosphoribosylformylglycinamidine synthase I [Planctomycetota bacterium]
MSEPRVLVLRAAGVNCNEETAHAFALAGAAPDQVHINRLVERPEVLDDYGALAIPGGFSYGDDVSAGAVLALEIDQVLGDALRRLIERGGLVLGICNGFQVLIKTGLLPGPGVDSPAVRATLTDNRSHRYEDRWVRLECDGSRSLFLSGSDMIELPMAHAEGRFTVGGPEDLAILEEQNRVALRYVAADGGPADYPANPNGSVAGIAGICDESGQVLGLMPHPERFLFGWQHPRWTRSPLREIGDGARIFHNAVRHLRS